MTDNPQWQAPGTDGATPPPYAPGGTPPGVAQNPTYPAWTPPPKPGLVPLRPLELGDILGGSFRVLRRNPKPTFGAALLIEGISVTLVLVVVGLVTFASLSRLNFSEEQDTGVVQAGAIATIVLATLGATLFTIATTALLQGIIVLEVSRATLGEKQTLRDLWRRAHGRLWALIGWSLLVSAAVAAAIIVLVVAVTLTIAVAGTLGIALGVLLAVFGALTLVALGFWIGTKLSLVSSALMIERLSLRGAITRSWTLTTGAFWKTLGIQLLVAVIINVALQVISAPLSLLSPLFLALIDPNGQGQAPAIGLSIGLAVLATAITVVFGAIGAVVQSATSALIYLDRRIRKEGLDLQLARFVEGRSSAAVVADPYLPGSERLHGPAAPIPPADASPWA